MFSDTTNEVENNHSIYELNRENYPTLLHEIPQPPKKLYVRGNTDLPNLLANKKILTVVGPRKYTSYGRDCTRSLILSLRGLPVVIVSGLAYGIDSIAHEAAIEAGIPTIAFPGSGLAFDTIYPKHHRNLAERILNSGGILISEFEPKQKAASWMFPVRNRLVAGIAHAVLIPEAGEKSGTLITARLTCEYNRDLLVVPGNINSATSKGTNQFLRLGAIPITSADDLREALGFTTCDEHAVMQKSLFKDLSENEKIVMNSLIEPKTRNTLAEELPLSPQVLNATLSLLEIKELIREENSAVFPVSKIS